MSAIKYFLDVPRSLCTKKQAQKAVQRHTICIYYVDHGYILDEIYCQDQIEYKRNYTMCNNFNGIIRNRLNKNNYNSKYINVSMAYALFM